ncbi:MAG: hypothetical protein KAW66_13745 [Candidatus Lokiarchaeota archaeon]|nr:hypothetical protein [Candidatus Lokiarchaeota archaeon]
MIAYLDSELFYLIFLGWLIGLCVLNGIVLILRYKNRKVSMWIIVNRFLLISSIAVFILISIPYLFIDIFEVPLLNIILSNIYALLLCVSAVLYEYTITKETINSRKNLSMKNESNL